MPPERKTAIVDVVSPGWASGWIVDAVVVVDDAANPSHSAGVPQRF